METPPTIKPTNIENVEKSEARPSELPQELHDLYNLEANIEKRSYFKAHPERFQKMLRVGRIVAGSLFLSIGPLTATQTPDREENARTAQHEVHKIELRKKLTELFGFDALRSIEASGFKVTYSVEAGTDDPVILHIGQVHPTNDQGSDTRSEGIIAGAQMSIQKIIALLPAADRTIFDEGISHKEMEGFERAQKIIAESTALFQTPITEKSMSELQTLYDGLKPRLLNIPTRPLYAINHLFNERAQKIKEFLTSKNLPHEDFIPEIMDTVHNEKDVDPLQAVFLQGATLHCFAKQQCDLQPVANYGLITTAIEKTKEADPLLDEAHKILSDVIKPEVSDANFKILVDLGEWMYLDHNKFFEKVSMFVDADTLGVLRAKLSEVRKITRAADEFTFAKRERFALTAIEESRKNTASNQRIIPLIYGNQHNFTSVVNEFNAREKRPATYGLITMTYNGKNVADLRSRTGPK